MLRQKQLYRSRRKTTGRLPIKYDSFITPLLCFTVKLYNNIPALLCNGSFLYRNAALLYSNGAALSCPGSSLLCFKAMQNSNTAALFCFMPMQSRNVALLSRDGTKLNSAMTKESSAETNQSRNTPSLPAKAREKRSFRAQTTSGTLHRRSRRRQFAHAHGTIRSHGLSFSISGSQRFGFSILPHLAHPPPRNRPAIPRRQRKPPPRLRLVHPAAKSQRVAFQHFSVSVFNVLKRAPADEPQIVRRGRSTIMMSWGQTFSIEGWQPSTDAAEFNIKPDVYFGQAARSFAAISLYILRLR
jgi:hypothetical protein